MSNPYSVLGVDRNATDEQIKSAYKELAQKYSPENFTESPLSDLAANKMTDIIAAYDQIMSERRLAAIKSEESSSNRQSSQSPYSDFSAVRSYLNAGNYAAAENILLEVPANGKNAEWNFLMGRVCQMKGWLSESAKYFNKACQLDPQNMEYQNAKNSAQYARNNSNNMNGNPYNRGYNTQNAAGGCSGCDICSNLLLADCCCECMGGDLIRCC